MKPIIYLSSPYTKGDPTRNAKFQMKVWDELMTDGRVWPVAPLWSHFQHEAFPRSYAEWLEYDLALLPSYHGCLRLAVDEPGYHVSESKGADMEVAAFHALGKPVFTSKAELYAWVEKTWPG